MTSIWDLSTSWTGYLERGPVVLQLLIAMLPVLLISIASRRLPPEAAWRRRHRGLSLLAVAAGTSVLALFRLPTGLAVFLGAAYGWWALIDWTRHRLEPVVESHVLQQIDSGLVRPLFVMVTGLMLVNKVNNLDELAMVPLGAWFGTTLDLGELCWSLATVYLVITASGPLAMLLSLLLGRVLNLTEGSRRGFTLVIRYSMVALGLIWALDHTGFDRTAILAIAGGLSVGLGFGIKEVVSNFISGLWLLFEGSVRPGEVLYIDDDACEVRRLGLRAALLWRDRDNTELLIPNQLFFSTTTTTFTGSDGMRRCQVQVMAAYRHRPRDVMALMVQTAAAVPKVLAEPAPAALILDYGESGVMYAVRFWIARPMEGTVVSSAVREAIWEAFAAHAIEIPYPQRVLHQA